jgi:hypothetical protein
VLHLAESSLTAANTIDVFAAIVVDMAREFPFHSTCVPACLPPESLLRGVDTVMAPSHTYEWLDKYPIADRVIPEGFGYSLAMTQLALTVGVECS